MTMSRTLWLSLAWLCITCSTAEKKCERLKSSLTYTQDKAPRDLSGVLPVVVERINRELEGVVDVEVEWKGDDLHAIVGDHWIQSKVTRLVDASTDPQEQQQHEVDSEGRPVLVQCFLIPFTIQDTNECLLPKGNKMRHSCREPSLCVNTIGGYECMCPRLGQTDLQLGTLSSEEDWKQLMNDGESRGPWELSFPSAQQSSCPSSVSTYACCSTSDAHSDKGRQCRAAFRCPVDPCSNNSNNDCASNAKCVRNTSPHDNLSSSSSLSSNTMNNNYSCQCPHGLMGSGRKCRKDDATPRPMVKFDGKTPTEETLLHNYYCSCTKPQVDACEGFPACEGHHEVCTVTSGNIPVCACKPGYVDSNDGYGCVDESPPVLALKYDPDGDQTLRLTQGDFYKEHAVTIIDDNAEEYMRSLRITYSQPLPPGCMTQVGQFHVNYTVATPWTSYQYVRVTRNVIVKDINECTLTNKQQYEETCPQLVPKCDFAAGATCVNTIGSYSCQCPDHTSGDGYQKHVSFPAKATPDGYTGGTSCVDTSKPIINLVGPNPKVLKVCKCGGLTGVMGNNPGEQDAFCTEQRKKYGTNLKQLIESTSGAELCATHDKLNPKPEDCVKATDHNYRGTVDLTSKVEIGTPIEKSPLHWSVPYNVVDAAGNKATTVWRKVVIEEVDIYDLEQKVRKEVLAEKKDSIQQAVDKAVAAERTKMAASSNSKNRAMEQQQNACPACPKCSDCSNTDMKSKCNKYCATQYSGTCPASCQSDWDAGWEWMFTIASSHILGVVAATIVGILILRFVFTLMFNPKALFGPSEYNYQNNINTATATTATSTTHYAPQTPNTDPRSNVVRRPPEGGLFSPPPDTSVPIYSPATNNGYGGGGDNDLYRDIITPNSKGDLRKRR